MSFRNCLFCSVEGQLEARTAAGCYAVGRAYKCECMSDELDGVVFSSERACLALSLTLTLTLSLTLRETL
jgi:hypothetical protein